MLTACKKEQQGVVLADEGLRGQQEGGGELRRFPFGDSYGTCVVEILLKIHKLICFMTCLDMDAEIIPHT